ncbi:MAG: leucyl aminopeptidase [Candidatus Hydrogenedentes bacterium]|nr:leucyl aminopeptidase [Candidatus Hydrogenedentota bacterium]
MRVHVVQKNGDLLFESSSALIVPAWEDSLLLNGSYLHDNDELALQSLIDREIFKGKAEEHQVISHCAGAYDSAIMIGLGKKNESTPEIARRAAGALCPTLKTLRIKHLYLDLGEYGAFPVTAFLDGIVLGQYEFNIYKETPESGAVPEITDVSVLIGESADGAALEAACRVAVLMCLSANGARHLANTPPNEMTPRALADFARGIARESGCNCLVLEPEALADLGMNALLGVARGSAEPARLIVLHHHHSDTAKTIAIVGKGVTFDTGGISIKPAASMHEMKYDMCGAAAVLCTMMTITELKPPINVVCVVPAAENMTGDAAQRPGDIVRTYSGKTVEVHNTDAEGRLILADALAYTIAEYKPDLVVDLATLTGACVVALGHFAAGIFSTSDDLADDLQTASNATGERLWRLPLWKDYDKLIEGTHADICNIGPREGGAISAAAFLKHFVGDTPWAHIDIAGTAWGVPNTPYWNTKHATGYGVRLLTQWILNLAHKGS